MMLEHVWFDWWHEGYTEEDLRLTIAYLSKLYAKRPDVLAACLRLRRLIGDTLFFAQHLAEARKIVRVREESAKESVLRSTGRTTVPETKPARSAGDILKADQAFQQFVELKGKL